MHPKMKLLVFAVASVLAVRPLSAGAEAKECLLSNWTTPPSWISGAVSVSGGIRLVVVDPIQGRLFETDSSGATVPVPSIDLRGGDGSPVAISSLEDSIVLLEVAENRIVRLDENLHVTNENFFLPNKTSWPRLGSMYQWKVAGSSIVAFGSVSRSEQEVLVGFFRITLGDTQREPELLMPFNSSDYYLIGYPYIATIGTTTYYVAMGEKPEIFKVMPREDPVKLEALKLPIALNPTFKTVMRGPTSAPAHFAELETFTVISGLYSRGGFLYLLTRRPDAGKTAWLLYKIDPVAQMIVSELRLPTTANHLTVVPSEKNWILVERGAVQERQRRPYQEFGKIIFIANRAIEAPEGLLSCSESRPAESSQSRVPQTKFLAGTAGVVLLLMGMVVVVFIKNKNRRKPRVEH